LHYEVDEKRKDEKSLGRSSVSQSRSRQMLPVLCLSEQFPASLRLARGSLSAKAAPLRESGGQLPFGHPCFPKDYFSIVRWSHHDYRRIYRLMASAAVTGLSARRC